MSKISNARILVISPLWPQSAHTVRAGNVVLFELIREISRKNKFHVGFLKVNIYEQKSISIDENIYIEKMKEMGIEVLDPLQLPIQKKGNGVFSRVIDFAKLLSGRTNFFYPFNIYSDMAIDRANSFKPDLLFIPWSEIATALFASSDCRKFTYYGNPDPKVIRARAKLYWPFGKQVIRSVYFKIFAMLLERKHLRLIKKYDYMGNVAANDAAYYRKKGHKNSFYIQNVWIDRFSDKPPSLSKTKQGNRIPVIIGSIGRVNGTANIFGLTLLGREIVPELRKLMNGRPFEIHILGVGEVHPVIKKYLEQKEIVLKGFVDDIDRSLSEANLFLCANNGSEFNVGHTRYLHAWSLGCPVIAYKAAALAMPEIKHQYNALLGKDSGEVAKYIYEALNDFELSIKIGQGGYKTFRSKFTAQPVVDSILQRIELNNNNE